MKLFSLIELLTVVLVILLLMSLIIPSFVNLKSQARSTLCKSNLRQIGTLLTSYQSEYGGYLPNDEAKLRHPDGTACPPSASNCQLQHIRGDIHFNGIGNNNLYQNWNGHLIPFLDIQLPDKYTREASVTKVGTTRFEKSQFGGPANLPPNDPFKNGWIVVDEAYRNGGYNELKLFICPEIQQNTKDIAALKDFQGIEIPRISQLCRRGFPDKLPYAMEGGIPTTYLANDYFFGYGVFNNSFRMDEIDDVSQKIFLLEGGLANAASTASMMEAYYVVTRLGYEGGDLAKDHRGVCSSTISDNYPMFHKLSFVHDNPKEFWICDDGNMPRIQWSRADRMEFVAKFNEKFKGKAYMIPSSIPLESNQKDAVFTTVSFIDPMKGAAFQEFIVQNQPAGPIGTWGYFKPYDSNDFNYLTGEMNVLFGDGAVIKKDQGWLTNNRIKIARPSKSGSDAVKEPEDFQ